MACVHVDGAQAILLSYWSWFEPFFNFRERDPCLENEAATIEEVLLVSVRVMMDPCDPCAAVIRTSLAVMARDDVSVTIDQAALENFADDYSAERVQSMRKEVEWDACDWHYTPKDLPGDSTAQYIFVMDSLNYCFWPVEGLEYEQLATSLRDVLKADASAFDTTALKSMTSAQLQVPLHSVPPSVLTFHSSVLSLFRSHPPARPPSLAPSLRPCTLHKQTTTPGLVSYTHPSGDRWPRASPTRARLGP